MGTRHLSTFSLEWFCSFSRSTPPQPSTCSLEWRAAVLHRRATRFYVDASSFPIPRIDFPSRNVPETPPCRTAIAREEFSCNSKRGWISGQPMEMPVEEVNLQGIVLTFPYHRGRTRVGVSHWGEKACCNDRPDMLDMLDMLRRSNPASGLTGNVRMGKVVAPCDITANGKEG